MDHENKLLGANARIEQKETSLVSFRVARRSCVNCKDQNQVCSGRITHKDDVESTSDATGSRKRGREADEG